MDKKLPQPLPAARRTFRRWLIGLACLVLVAGGAVLADWWIGVPDDETASYVGRSSCVECHQREAALFEGSHHDLAMDRASEQTVLGDFNDATLTHFGTTSRMFRRDGRFFVNTEGPDGTLADFEVKYVLGVDPLQQYMVEFDRPTGMPDNEIARLQVLRICWDTHDKRWFFLSPFDAREKLRPDDVLHWTGIAQCWNTSCADCHSTDLRKNYDPQSKVYHTTFSEIDVSCEACHGPGSVHVKLARSWSPFWDRKRGYGLVKLKGESSEPQIQACAPCHSRRGMIYPGYLAGQPYYDHFRNELLTDLIYYPDGQVLDENYVYGSFLQSKMYHKGVRCTDCHDPHSTRLKHQGNEVCTSCHAHSPGKYDGPAHHRHQSGSSGASCVECHMPERTYMDVDPRRDHSIRVPRPDLSVELGTPNACTRCHLDVKRLPAESAEGLTNYAEWLRVRDSDPAVDQELERLDRWALEKVSQWYGDKTSTQPHFAHVLAQARDDQSDCLPQLSKLALDRREQSIVRATATLELARFPGRNSQRTLIALLNDSDPQVRAAAIGGAQGMLSTAELVRYILPLVEDPVRVVRFEAARVTASIPDRALTSTQRNQRQQAIDEFIIGLKANSERALSHLVLATLYEARGDDEAAEAAYRLAIHVEPTVSGPRDNLAALLERRASGATPQSSELRREEFELLRRDAALAPQVASLQYRFGLACYLQGQLDDAEQALLRACQTEPRRPEYLLALALLYEHQRRYADAIRYTKTLIELRPEDPTYRQVLARIEQSADQPIVGPQPR